MSVLQVLHLAYRLLNAVENSSVIAMSLAKKTTTTKTPLQVDLMPGYSAVDFLSISISFGFGWLSHIIATKALVEHKSLYVVC